MVFTVRHFLRISFSTKSPSSGFTLLELMITIAILSLLMALAIPNYFGYIEKARITKTISELHQLQTRIDAFEIDNFRIPINLEEIGSQTLLDAWGNPYQFLNFSTVKGKGKMRKDRFLVPINTTYDLYSMGSDGRSATPLTAKISRDDIIRGSDGAFIGLASYY